MCGIAGLAYTDNCRSVDPGLIETMCTAIHHRGPDDWGMWCDGPIAIGMKRLQIIDLVGGHQPMVNSGGNLHIVFNGEIYNYRELRRELQAKGYQFTSSSDTETILYAYEEYGQDCVKHLRGMFAFAIWDACKRQLFLARDRFGKKPLHYFFDRDKLIFGSEIKSILKHPELKPQVHRPAVAQYLGYGYVPDPDTMFKGINKLPAGHSLTWKCGEISIRRYWDLDFMPDQSPQPEWPLFQNSPQ